MIHNAHAVGVSCLRWNSFCVSDLTLVNDCEQSKRKVISSRFQCKNEIAGKAGMSYFMIQELKHADASVHNVVIVRQCQSMLRLAEDVYEQASSAYMGTHEPSCMSFLLLRNSYRLVLVSAACQVV